MNNPDRYNVVIKDNVIYATVDSFEFEMTVDNYNKFCKMVDKAMQGDVGASFLDDKDNVHPLFTANAFKDDIQIKRLTSGQSWHPASEVPPVDVIGESEYLIVYDLNGYAFSAFYSRKRGWCDENGRHNLEIKWWCYPPK